jgi:predicted phage terminase large subunit-like protein
VRWTEFIEEAALPPPPPPRGEKFRDFISRVSPSFRFYPYHECLIEAAEAIKAGGIPWLMVFQPPGSSKSEVFSRLLPAWLVSEDPTQHVAVCTYGASLAHGLTRDAREYAIEAGVRLDAAQKAKISWKTAQGGHVWGSGFGGAVRGNRYHKGIVDDPHKGPEELFSDVRREALFRWWDQTWMNRRFLLTDSPTSRVIVMQRLAENDLCGHLLDRPDSDKWTVLALDAEKSDEPFVGEKCGAKIITDDRQIGELLIPDKLTKPELQAYSEADLDAYLAQFQQRPRAFSGVLLDPAWFSIIQEKDVPPLIARGMGVDLAVSTKTSADYTVGFAGGIGQDLRVYLFRPFREQWEAPDCQAAIAELARRRRCTWVAVESVAYQLSFVQHLRRMREMAGISVIEADADRDKESRARGWSPRAKQGRFVLVEDGSGWTRTFLDEVKGFPRGRYKDQVDAVGILDAALHERIGASGTASGGQRIKVQP